MIGDPARLEQFLLQAQRRRQEHIVLTLCPPLATQMNRQRLTLLLDSLLPLVQRRSQTLRRERDGRWYINMTVRYRTGLTLADALEAGAPLTGEQTALLARAQALAAPLRLIPDELGRARALLETVAAQSVYENPAPGCIARAQVVDAAGALLRGRANCQGVSDALFLLARLCGLQAGYCCGRKRGEAHLWNVLLLKGQRWDADASSRLLACDPQSLAAAGLERRSCLLAETFMPDK